MSVDVVERLRLNEDDWLFGQTARDARREITTLREQVEKLAKERDAYCETMYDVGNCAAEFLTRAEHAEQQLAAAPTPPSIEDRKDADRYRWLCETATAAQWVEFGGCTNKQHIDIEIDAAMQEDKP